MMFKPFCANTSFSGSAIRSTFSERGQIRLSCTSSGMRVGSSIRATFRSASRPLPGPGTIASCDGPFDSNRASFQPWRIASSLVRAAPCTTSVESLLNEANTAHVHNSTCGHPRAFAIVRVLLLQRKKS
jgi:hypothetical protein